MPYLKCVDEEEAKYILKEVHSGICGDHVGSRSLVNKVIRAEYFGQPCRWTLLISSEGVTNASDTGMCNGFQQRK